MAFRLIIVPAVITLAVTLVRLPDNCSTGRQNGSVRKPAELFHQAFREFSESRGWRARNDSLEWCAHQIFTRDRTKPSSMW